MPTVLDLITPVLLRVDADGNVQAADGPESAAWLEAQEIAGLAGPVEAWDRSLLRLCGVADPAALVGVDGPWRSLPLPGGEYLVIGGAWQSGETIAERVGLSSLQAKQAILNVLPAAAAEAMAGRGLPAEGVPRVDDRVRRRGRVLAPGRPRRPGGACIRQLDFYFSLFNQITSAFGVEKVAPIGDTYTGGRRGAAATSRARGRRDPRRRSDWLRRWRPRPGPVVDEWEWSFPASGSTRGPAFWA